MHTHSSVLCQPLGWTLGLSVFPGWIMEILKVMDPQPLLCRCPQMGRSWALSAERHMLCCRVPTCPNKPFSASILGVSLVLHVTLLALKLLGAATPPHSPGTHLFGCPPRVQTLLSVLVCAPTWLHFQLLRARQHAHTSFLMIQALQNGYILPFSGEKKL